MVGKKLNGVLGNTCFHLFYNSMKKSKASSFTNRKKVFKKNSQRRTPLCFVAEEEFHVQNINVKKGKEAEDLAVPDTPLHSGANEDTKDKFMSAHLTPSISTREQEWKEDDAVLGKSRCSGDYIEIQSSTCRNNPEAALALSVKNFPLAEEAGNSTTPNAADIPAKKKDKKKEEKEEKKYWWWITRKWPKGPHEPGCKYYH